MARILICLLAVTLTACAAPAAKPTAPKAVATKIAAAPATGEQIVCTDETATGSNIRRRRCERLTDELRRQRQAQINRLQRPSGANSATSSGVK